ncbi:MAG TPA: hypothetical protein VMV93_14230, partial [Chloroflexota bacterium]|nr:hypothetical protein [Chloroflexota bacterium]
MSEARDLVTRPAGSEPWVLPRRQWLEPWPLRPAVVASWPVASRQHVRFWRRFVRGSQPPTGLGTVLRFLMSFGRRLESFAGRSQAQGRAASDIYPELDLPLLAAEGAWGSDAAAAWEDPGSSAGKPLAALSRSPVAAVGELNRRSGGIPLRPLRQVSGRTSSLELLRVQQGVDLTALGSLAAPSAYGSGEAGVPPAAGPRRPSRRPVAAQENASSRRPGFASRRPWTGLLGDPRRAVDPDAGPSPTLPRALPALGAAALSPRLAAAALGSSADEGSPSASSTLLPEQYLDLPAASPL